MSLTGELTIAAVAAARAALESKRQAYILKLKKILDDATEAVRKAQNDLAVGDTDVDARLKKLRSAKRAHEKAEAAFLEAGGIDSVIPELEGIVVIA